MDQKKLINLYNKNLNSMFDDSESSEEIKDSVKSVHDNYFGLYKKDDPWLFNCILKIMFFEEIYHERDDFFSQAELNKITILQPQKLAISSWVVSYFKKFSPRINNDFSIIFKYLKNVQKIDACCFEGCKNLKFITIPNFVKFIGNGAFENCSNLEIINLPNSIKILPFSCFHGCGHLEIINLPKKLKEINSYCFIDCRGLKEINLPSSLSSINRNAFQCCTNLRSISIPNSVTEIGDNCFQDCISLKKITIPRKFEKNINKIFPELNFMDGTIKITYI